MTIELNNKMTEALNKQVNAELWSSYLYLSMACDMRDKNFDGIGSWFEKQAKEEVEHAEKIIQFIINRGGKVKLMPIEGVKTEWDSPKEAFQDTLAHEKLVSQCIYDLYELAVQLKDFATQKMLSWFIEEQVEEESVPSSLLHKLEMIGENYAALLLLDEQLGRRV